jgi:hypothetical protein
MIFHSVFGFLVWLAATLALRFYGEHVITVDDIRMSIIAITAAPVLWGFMVLYLGILRVLPENRALAAIAFCLPGMFLDAAVTSHFGLVFPNIDASLDKTFGALMLWAYAWLLFGGYSSDRRAKKAHAKAQALKIPIGVIGSELP